MNVFRLLLREIWHRKLHFTLSLLAVIVAATLFVTAPVLLEGHARKTDEELAKLEDETRKLMRDMGFNLMIVHRDTDLGDFWSQNYIGVDMPQGYVQKLAEARELTLVTHIVATLQEKIKWQDRTVLLVGYLPEATQTHRKKKAPMGYNIERGTVYLGHELAGGRKPGDEVEVLGRKFRVARVLREQGSAEDISLAMHLDDAQELLEREERVNKILALGCRCAGERLPKVRKQLEAVLPETKITEFRSMALARAEQRDLVEATANELQGKLEMLAVVTVPVVVLACAIWLGLLALSNVRERKMEIGVMRALGVGSGKVASLFIGKAVLLGLAGGVIGCLVGVWLGRFLGVQAFDAPAELFRASATVVVATTAGAPLVSAMASYLPTLLAVLQDPAVVLREE